MIGSPKHKYQPRVGVGMADIRDAIQARMGGKIGIVVYVEGNPLGTLVEGRDRAAEPDASPEEIEEAVMPFPNQGTGLANDVLIVKVQAGGEGHGWSGQSDKGWPVRLEVHEQMASLGGLSEAADAAKGRIEAVTDANTSGRSPDIITFNPTN